MITGNIGEWSELYVLLKLLADGKLYAADADLNKLNEVYSPLLKVFRQEIDTEEIEYRVDSKKHEVELYINGDKIKRITSTWLSDAVSQLYAGIKSGNEKGAFSIPASQKIMSEMHCKRIKAKTEDKADIKVQIHDTMTGRQNICGFSIKSDLGAAPSLLNASQQTNFIYRLENISSADMNEINSINTKTKIIDRIEKIGKLSEFRFVCVDSETFSQNLTLIDSMMDDILGNLLIYFYRDGLSKLTDAVTALERDNPLGYAKPGVYRYKVKKFLCAVALGMVPGKAWDGRDEANGGYIIVKKDGDVVTYHLYNRDNFETYLLNNTRFERPSTGRNKYAEIYDYEGEKRIRLNMQIRFI